MTDIQSLLADEMDRLPGQITPVTGEYTGLSDHGNIVNDAQLDLIPGIKWFCTSSTEYKHRVVYKLNPNATKTVVFVPGGAGRLHSITDSTLVMPLTYVTSNDLPFNIVVLDFDHGMSQSGMRRTGSRSGIRYIKSMFANLESAQKFFDRAPRNILYTAFNEFTKILLELKEKIDVEHVWLVGHSNSTEFLARYVTQFRNEICDGLIFMAPKWRDTIKGEFNEYFQRDIRIPLLLIRHENDLCPGITEELAEMILENSNSPRQKHIVLTGGDNYGLPRFSMGHHGFRGLDSEITATITNFIHQ